MKSPKTIVVSAKDYSRFLKARRIASAIARHADKLKETFNLPDASKANAGEWLVLDGNAQPIGKLTIAERDGYQVKKGWTARLS